MFESFRDCPENQQYRGFFPLQHVTKRQQLRYLFQICIKCVLWDFSFKAKMSGLRLGLHSIVRYATENSKLLKAEQGSASVSECRMGDIAGTYVLIFFVLIKGRYNVVFATKNDEHFCRRDFNWLTTTIHTDALKRGQ